MRGAGDHFWGMAAAHEPDGGAIGYSSQSGDRRTRAQAAQSVPAVLGLEKCFVRKVGFRYYVDLHVVTRGDLTVREGHRIAHEVENSVLERVNRVSAVMVHIEPEEELLRES